MTIVEERKNWVVTIAVCTGLAVLPLLITAWVAKPDPTPEKRSGTISFGTGKLLVPNPRAAELDITMSPRLLAENLNRLIAEESLGQTYVTARLKNTDKRGAGEILSGLRKHPRELDKIEDAAGRNILWRPEGSRWGLYTEPNAPNPDPEDASFGLIEIQGGRETNIFQTEKSLNFALATLRANSSLWMARTNARGKPPDALEVLAAARALPEPPLSKEEAIRVLALAEVLNINYQPAVGLGLFLTPETAEEFEETLKPTRLLAKQERMDKDQEMEQKKRDEKKLLEDQSAQ